MISIFCFSIFCELTPIFLSVFFLLIPWFPSEFYFTGLLSGLVSLYSLLSQLLGRVYLMASIHISFSNFIHMHIGTYLGCILSCHISLLTLVVLIFHLMASSFPFSFSTFYFIFSGQLSYLHCTPFSIYNLQVVQSSTQHWRLLHYTLSQR